MNFSIIVAIGKNREIGKNGIMPWDIKADLKHFADITVGQKNNAVIMGRKTWESIPKKFRPLKDRLNVILSRQSDLSLPEGVIHYSSLDRALKNLAGFKELFIIGGGSLYAEAIRQPECNKLYITEIQGNYEADTYFPKISDKFKKTEESKLQSEGDYEFKFITYIK